MKRKVLLIPLIIFLAIAAALLWQLARNAEGDDPTNLEVSPRITGQSGAVLSGGCADSGQTGAA